MSKIEKNITLLILFIFTTFVFFNFTNIKKQINHQFNDFNSQWNITEVDTNEFILTNTLPNNLKDEVLYFNSNYFAPKIYIDNKLVYDYNNYSDIVLNAIIKLNINKEHNNKKIKIIMSSPLHRKKFYLPNITLTSKNNFYKQTCKQLIPISFYLFTCFLLSFVFLLNFIFKK